MLRRYKNMSNYTTLTSDKSKWTAFVICLICGWIPIICGAYYWYVGRKAGLIRLLTANYFFIGWVIDLIKILTGSFTDNTGTPLRR